MREAGYVPAFVHACVFAGMAFKAGCIWQASGGWRSYARVGGVLRQLWAAWVDIYIHLDNFLCSDCVRSPGNSLRLLTAQVESLSSSLPSFLFPFSCFGLWERSAAEGDDSCCSARFPAARAGDCCLFCGPDLLACYCLTPAKCRLWLIN